MHAMAIMAVKQHSDEVDLSVSRCDQPKNLRYSNRERAADLEVEILPILGFDAGFVLHRSRLVPDSTARTRMRVSYGSEFECGARTAPVLVCLRCETGSEVHVDPSQS